MFSRLRFLRGLDLRALPIAVKIAIGLAIMVSLTGLVTDQVLQQVLRDSQSDLTLNELSAFSRSQAFRLVDTLGEEVTSLSRIGAGNVIEVALEEHNTGASLQPGEKLLAINQAVNQQIAAFRSAHPEFDSVVLLDLKGHILGAEPIPADITVSEPTWVWFTGTMATPQGVVYVSGPQDDQLTGLRGVHIAVPIYSVSQPDKLIGVAYGIWNVSNLGEIAQPTVERQGAIVQADGTSLLSGDIAPGEKIPENLVAEISAATNNSFLFVDGAGQTWLYGRTRLVDLGLGDPAVSGLDWMVLTRQPLSTLDASVNFLLTRLRLVLGIVAGLVSLGILFFSRTLFLPLVRLTSAATEIQAGNLDRHIPQFPLDEIGQLAEALGTLVEELTNRVRQLRHAVQVSRTAALKLDINQMLDEVARSLSQQFHYPDVRVYLADASGKRIRLQAVVGTESERLLKSGYRLPLDETSLVGRAMLLNEPVLGAGETKLREAGMASAYPELALPLQAGGQSLGGIHIYSGHLRDFSEEEIDILRLVADQVSASIQNARLFEQSAANIREIEALNRRLTRQAWDEFISEKGLLRHTLDPDQQWPNAPESLRLMEEIKAETYSDADGRLVLAAPLILRGEMVGTLAVTRPAGENWTNDEVLLLQSIASRMVIIAEGIRLVEESTERADREQRVNEISASFLQRATSVDAVLRTALDELGNALGSDRVSLRLGAAPVRDGRQIGSGSLENKLEGDGQPPANSAGDTAAPAGGNGDGGVNNVSE